MQDETAAALNRPAAQNIAVAHGRGQADHVLFLALLQFVEHVDKAHVLDGLVDDEPHRALVRVANHVDHGVTEALVAHAGHRHQKLAPEGIHRTSPSPVNLLHAAVAAICRSRSADRGVSSLPRCSAVSGLPMLRSTLSILLTLLAAPALAAATAEQELAPGVAARLIAAPGGANGTTYAALELNLPPGAHTYWRL